MPPTALFARRSANNVIGRRARVFLAPLLATIALAGCGDGVGGPPRDASSFAVSAEWINPLPQVGTCFDVAAVGPDQFVVAGRNGTVLFRDRGRWSAHHLDSGGILSAWGSSLSDVFVGASDGAIYHYDGEEWMRQESGITNGISPLHGSGPANVWAGGRGVARYDGLSWTSMAVPWRFDTMGLWVESPVSVFAASLVDGVYRFDGSDRTKVLHDSTLDSDGGGFPFWFTDIWGRSATDLYAITNGGTIHHFDGTTWSRTTLEGRPGLQTIGGGPSGDVWLASWLFGPMYRGSGTTWERVDGPAAGDVYSLAIAPDGAGLAIGIGGYLFELDENNWIPAWTGYLGYEYGLASVVAIDGGLGCFGGRASVYLKLDGSAVDAIPFDTLRVRDAYSPNGDDVFAVGVLGNVRRRVRGNWVSDATGVDAALMSVHGTSARDVWAAGERGTILHFDGAAWTRVPAPTSADILSVCSIHEDLAYALPDAPGLVLEYSGGAWRRVEDARLYGLRAIWGTRGDAMIGVGDDGRVVRLRDGRLDEEMASGVAGDLLSVHGNASGVVVAVGGSTIVRWNGAAWERIGAAGGGGLSDVWVDDDGSAVVVGERGAILRVPGGAGDGAR